MEKPFSKIPSLNHKSPSEKVDIIIVGAGLSGLTSAWRLLQKERSLQIKILEATNAIGGQICESRLGELGGKWMTEDQNHIQRLLQDLKITTRRRTVVAPNRKRCWDIDRGLLSRLARYELRRYLRELDIMAQFYKPGGFDTKKRSKTMHRHITNRLFFNKSRKFMLNLVQLICGVDAHELSYPQFMSICYTCGGINTLMDIYLECPNTLKEISSSKLLEAFTEKLKLAEILYWRKVYEVHQYRDYIEVRDSEHENHTADAVILAIPWNNIQDIFMTPPMPMELRKPPVSLDRGKQMITSFIADYNDGHWRRAGYSGNFLSSSPMLIIGNEYRLTTYSGIVVHEEGIEPLVRSIALKSLAEHFGEEMLLPLSYTQHTYEQSSLVNFPFTTPWNRVIWSSSAAAATCYRGCLGGAVQSGLRAAMNALLVVRPQTVIWQDIAEIQSCETCLQRGISAFRLWTCTWNLYNVSFYGLFVYGVFSVLKHWSKKTVYT